MYEELTREECQKRFALCDNCEAGKVTKFRVVGNYIKSMYFNPCAISGDQLVEDIIPREEVSKLYKQLVTTAQTLNLNEEEDRFWFIQELYDAPYRENICTDWWDDDFCELAEYYLSDANWDFIASENDTQNTQPLIEFLLDEYNRISKKEGREND